MFGLIKKALIFSVFVAVAAIAFVYFNNLASLKKLEQLEQWAEENKITLDKSQVQPFKIEFDQNEWDLLIKKLNRTRYFTALDEKYVKPFEVSFF